MRDLRKFYIGGEWVAPSGAKTLDVINPATEEPFATIALGTEGDVDRAVKAAQAAFDGYAALSREERVALFERIIEHYMARFQELAAIISEEMGAPMKLALEAQAASGVGHLQTTLAILKEFAFAERRNGYELMREPIGVVAMITPWNWPANQIMC
ncbi:MAG TPA: aldehyde dehydrogenase family protein, partial [Parvularculaceae bacterium]|nr:aldehyde dehydrogenase family protein [Parvularculaceae bacterium]